MKVLCNAGRAVLHIERNEVEHNEVGRNEVKCN